MPARCNRLICCLPGAVLAVLLLALAACATQPSASSGAPDESALAPAQQALHKAISAHADDFAPQSVDAARRRITIARDILFSAAEAQRPLTSVENDRIDQLVAAARLDARAALVETQAKAVAAQIKQLQSPDNGQANGGGSGGLSGPAVNGSAAGGDRGLGIASPASGRSQSQGQIQDNSPEGTP